MSDLTLAFIRMLSLGFAVTEWVFAVAIANKWGWLIKETYLATNPDESPYRLRAILFLAVAMLAVIAERMKRP